MADELDKTTKREPVAPEEEPSQPSTPSLRDVGTTLSGWLHGRASAIRTLLQSHKLVFIGVVAALLATALGVVLLGINAAQTPDDSQVKTDASARLAPPSYTLGDYAVDEPLALKGVEVVRKGASGTRRDACTVDVVASYANSAMESRAEAQLTYVRNGTEWECTAASIEKASHHATASVSHERVIAQIDALLNAADQDESDTGLSSLYRSANVEVTSDEFDEEAQTSQLTLHCASNGTFVRYECDLTLHFRFAEASGAWELVEAQVSEGARDLSLSPIVGTWQGTFDHQQSSSQKCLAARDTGLTVTVSEVALTDDGGATIKGTLSGVAHLHADLARDADATDGDVVLDGAPFTGSISTGDVDVDVVGLLAGNDPKREDAGIVFDCTTQDVTDGEVTLTLTFGTSSAPDAAMATLTSTYNYQKMFLGLVPVPHVARFVDSFALEKIT